MIVTLGSSTQKAGGVAAQVIAAIAAVELPSAQWPDLIELLLSFVNRGDNTNLRIATLQTIGYICESIVSGHSLCLLVLDKLILHLFEIIEARCLERTLK